MNLEEKIKKLEEISNKVESGEMSLENSLLAFEQGIEIAKECLIQLDDCKGKLVVLENKLMEMKEND